MEVIAQDKEAVRAEKVAQQHFGQVEKALRQQLLNPEEGQPQKRGEPGEDDPWHQRLEQEGADPR